MQEELQSVQIRQRQADRAIQLAMASRWEEAVAVNRSIIDLFPNDTDSYNRLAKALMELGRLSYAKKTYKKALALDATNQIAKKNLERIAVLAKSGGGQSEVAQVDPKLFIEEVGKSSTTSLEDTVPDALAKLDAGVSLELRAENSTLTVATPKGERVGALEAKLGRRLIKLMEGGNKYGVAVTSIRPDECHVIIKETYQDPSQKGRPSFPAGLATKGTRPYTKRGLVRHETTAARPEDAENGEIVDGEKKEPWEDESELQEGDVNLSDAAAAEDAEEDELEE